MWRVKFFYGVVLCVDDNDKDGYNIIDFFVKKGNFVFVDLI